MQRNFGIGSPVKQSDSGTSKPMEHYEWTKTKGTNIYRRELEHGGYEEEVFPHGPPREKDVQGGGTKTKTQFTQEDLDNANVEQRGYILMHARQNKYKIGGKTAELTGN